MLIGNKVFSEWPGQARGGNASFLEIARPKLEISAP
jgi:hypothetical protein